MNSPSKQLPVVFISDFGPMPAVEESAYTRALSDLGKSLPKPKSILIMSGHWETSNVLKVTGTTKPTTIYDYVGFPKHFYDVSYPAPGSPTLATQVIQLLKAGGFAAETDPDRGLDHGAWAPLSRVFPQADIPVVQLSVPLHLTPEKIAGIGKTLSSLREQGVLLVAAGALIHNLSQMHFGDETAPVDAWAQSFQTWLFQTLEMNDRPALYAYRTHAPYALKAAPTSEHFDPLFFAMGAAPDQKPSVRFQEIRYGNGLLTILIWKN